MLENLKIKSRHYPCKIRVIYDGMSDADKEIFMNVLTDFSVGHSTLEKSLREVGIFVADTSIARHRLGHCSCSRI